MTPARVRYRASSFAEAMGDSTDGAIFNKCDPVSIGTGSRVSLENSFFTNCKKYQQISTNKIKDT